MQNNYVFFLMFYVFVKKCVAPDFIASALKFVFFPKESMRIVWPLHHLRAAMCYF